VTIESPGFALDQTTQIAEKQNIHIPVRVIHDLKSIPRLHLNPQFLVKLPLEALPRVFTLFNFSPWKLPEEAAARGWFSLDNEDPIVPENNPCCDNHDHWFFAYRCESIVERLTWAFLNPPLD
jgi:hypothetical protein